MESSHALWVLVVGAMMACTPAIGSFAQRVRVPAVVGYLALGLLLGQADRHWPLLGAGGRQALSFLADLGIVVLLFRVGLESNPAALLSKLKPASLVWIGDVAVSGGLGFLAAYHLVGLALGPALIIAAALSATSIGVSTAVWQNRGALGSPNGQLLIDVAELDDISGVTLMALLFAILPVLPQGGGDLLPPLLAAGAAFAAKFLAFAVFCFLFARYLEGPLTSAAARLEHAPQRMLTVAGLGFMIAALAGWLGFSLAIGALFAGLVFSRDPQAVRTEGRFNDLYAFFAPFFFIGIGLQTDVSLVGGALGAALVLFAAALLGKLLGDGLPTLLLTGATGAVLVGVSMVPRAEIALVIADQSRAAGALPEDAYAMLVLVSAATCLVAPWSVDILLRRWPQEHGRERRA